MIEKLYTVEEVAELASVTGRTIRNYLKSGRLVGRKIGGQWRFPESEVQRLLTGAVEPIPIVENLATNSSFEEANSYINAAAIPSAGFAVPNMPEEKSASFEEPVHAPVFASQNVEAAPATQSESVPAPTVFIAPLEAAPVIEDATCLQHPNGYATPAPLPAPALPAPTSQEPILSPPSQASAFSAPLVEPAFSPTGVHAAQAQSFAQTQATYIVPSPAAPPASTSYIPATTASPLPACTPASTNPPAQVPPQQASAATYMQQALPHNAVIVPQNPAINAQNTVYSAPAPNGFDTSQPAFYVATSPQGPFYPAFAPAGEAAPIMPSTKTEPTPLVPAEQEIETALPVPEESPVAAESVNPLQNSDEKLSSIISDVGRQVLRYTSEVHDCSKGPQICSIVDLHQSLATAKVTSERLNELAKAESKNGILCQCFVEFDERFFIARYTFFGSSVFLMRCLKFIG